MIYNFFFLMSINYEFVLCIVWDLVWKVIGLLMEFNSLLVIFFMVDRRMDVVCFLLVDDRFVEFIVCFIKRLLIEIVFYKVILREIIYLKMIDIVLMINKIWLCIRSYMYYKLRSKYLVVIYFNFI